MPLPLLFLLQLTVFKGACWADGDREALLQERLKAHIEFLAADELRGRLPGTRGYAMAAEYVSSQFKQTGLLPAGAKDSYLQQVPLRRAMLEAGSAGMTLHREDGSRDFVFVKEFFTGASLTHQQAELTAEIVFAGYGIHAPELGYSDFDSLDIKGKIVVTLGGQPLNFPSEEGAHFGSGRERARAMVVRGAVGWVTIYTPRNQRRFAWDRVKSRVKMPAMGWLTAENDPFAGFPELKGKATLHYGPATTLFEGADYSLADLLENDEKGEGLPIFALNGTLSLSQKSRFETIQSPNVAALLPGSDPLLSSEYIVYTAHLDHLGELHGDDHPDAINNGALDNASGISVMLETARIFVENGAPRRSILFVAVTAEEKGLVGSEYFAHNPTVPGESMVAVINLDMPVLLYEFGDVIAFGAEHSSMGKSVSEAVGDFGISLTPDPYPDLNIFVRSDHYRFVQQGIPSIYLVTGLSSLNEDENVQPILENFMKEIYHQPGDDLNLPFNFTAAARFTRINVRIGEIVANQADRPTWHEGDFFGTTFSR